MTPTTRSKPGGIVRLLTLAPLMLLALLLGDLLGIVRGPSRVDPCPAEAALVMGAAQYDGRPSPVFERRLRAALELYQGGCVERIVVSGGNRPGDRATEGGAGVAWLAAQGVPAAALAAEETAETSAQNVQRSVGLLGDGPVIVVSDDLHAWRAAWLARRAGLEARGYGVRVREDRLGYALREWAAMATYRIGWIR